MRILELAPRFGLGGTEKTVQIYCKYLSRRGDGVFAGALEPAGPRLPLIRRHVEDLVPLEGAPAAVCDAIRARGIDVIHAHAMQHGGPRVAALLTRCKAAGIRLVATEPFCVRNPEIEPLFDRVLFVSQTCLLKFMMQQGNRIDRPERYGYAYNPLDAEDLNAWRLTPAERVAQRRAWGLEADDFVIGRLARASLWKWDPAIVEVTIRLARAIPNLKAVIRACPDLVRRRLEKSPFRDRFVLLPETADEDAVSRTLQVMDVMLHTSRIGETFGVSLAEGMFYGLPMLTSSTDFRRRMLFERDNAQTEIVVDGRNGFVENGAAALAARLLALYRDPAARLAMGRVNRQDAVRRFGAESVVGRVAAILEGRTPPDPAGVLTDDVYQTRVKPESRWRLILENVRAVRDAWLERRAERAGETA